jgi:hypothetical protein
MLVATSAGNGARLPAHHAAMVLLPRGLLLLGPGAYSLDACSFGRRVIDLVGVVRNPKE